VNELIQHVEYAPDVEIADDDDGDVHQFCCDPDRALCGEDMSGWGFVSNEEPLDCIRCDVIVQAGVPCYARFCRLRRAWRALRGSS
jgi:hypothetical protein